MPAAAPSLRIPGTPPLPNCGPLLSVAGLAVEQPTTSHRSTEKTRRRRTTIISAVAAATCSRLRMRVRANECPKALALCVA